MKKYSILCLLIMISSMTLSQNNGPQIKKIPEEKYGNIISKTPLIEQIGSVSRLAGYQIIYEYAGKQYMASMSTDPGSQVTILSSPKDTDSAPIIKMTEAIPVKTPTAVEIAAATARPTRIITSPPISPFIYSIPSVRYIPPYPLLHPYYYFPKNYP